MPRGRKLKRGNMKRKRATNFKGLAKALSPVGVSKGQLSKLKKELDKRGVRKFKISTKYKK